MVQLLGLNLIPHVLAQTSKASLCSASWSSKLLIFLYTNQSSANNLIQLLIQSGRSLTYSKKRRGPSTVPCGTTEWAVDHLNRTHLQQLAVCVHSESHWSRLGSYTWCHNACSPHYLTYPVHLWYTVDIIKNICPGALSFTTDGFRLGLVWKHVFH